MPGRAAVEKWQLICRSTPRATKNDHEPQGHRSDDRAREEQPFDAMLDRVQNHEGKDEREEEQQHRA